MVTTAPVTNRKDRPLTRKDVEEMLKEAGDPSQLVLTRANLQGADLSGLILGGADLRGADLRGAILARADLRGADLTGADLTDADLTDADLTDATLTHATLTDATLTDAHLTDADLTDAHLRGAILARADLSDATLTHADLSDADLSDATLTHADLSDATLTDATLTDATLTGAIITAADLTTAILRGTDLTGADQTDDSVTSVWVRITQMPLQARTLADAVAALNDLYLRCALIHQRNLGDLALLAMTGNAAPPPEVPPLVVTQLTHNSLAEIKFDIGINATEVSQALRDGIDAVTQWRQRKEEQALRVAQIEQDIRLKDEQAQEQLALAAQERSFAAGRAALQPGREKLQSLALQLELLKAQQEYALEQLQRAVDAAARMVSMLYPDLGAGERAMVAQTLVPALLQLHSVEGLKRLSLPQGEGPATSQPEVPPA